MVQPVFYLTPIMKKNPHKNPPMEKAMPILMVPSILNRSNIGPHKMVSSSDSITPTVHTGPDFPSYESLVSRGDDLNLYNFPTSLIPTYRKIPLRNQVLVISLSFILAVLNVYRGDSKSLFFVGRNFFSLWKHWRKLMAPTILLSLLLSLILQETKYAPSRIDTGTLASRNWLPSRLSRFENLNISIPAESTQTSQEVHTQSISAHYLCGDTDTPQENDSTQERRVLDILHFNHGFGASSLSWLPAIPKFAEKLKSRVAIAHDAPGFGFTHVPSTYIPGDRSYLVPYSAVGNAVLGTSLIERFVSKPLVARSVGLFGHSMGCVATLLMAKMLAKQSMDTNVTIVLVAPAFVDLIPSMEKSLPKDTGSVSWRKNVGERIEGHFLHCKKFRQLSASIGAYLSYYLLEPAFQYLLRRTVGTKNFWRNGLSQAWGDSKLLSDTDVLRFQWPSIRKDWEKGLIAFTKSRILGVNSYPGGDFALLEEVVRMPNCRVVIAYGTKDAIVPIKQIVKIQKRFPNITYISFEGQGHDPFEEQPDLFVHEICNVIKLNSVKD